METDCTWRPYDGDADSTVVGDLRVSEPIPCPHLDIERELLVWVPPSYEEGDDTYPVVYMHDGQNLFDAATSNDGEWEVDETMQRLAADGREAIVVGIPNAEAARLPEYAPFVDWSAFPDPDATKAHMPVTEPLGDAYVDFLVETVVPLVDAEFRTTAERDATGTVGSSMGGLVSLYALFREPETFGFAGVMSPAVTAPFADIFEFVESAGHVDGRVYVDVGGDEFPDDDPRSEAFDRGAHRLVETLEGMGYDENLRFVYEEDAVHHEDAWARRFPDAMRFLLP